MMNAKVSNLRFVPGSAGSSTAPRFMSVKQVSDYLQLNEKKVYALVKAGKMPATKVTGKWVFPRDLIDQWLLESCHGGVLTDRLIVAGSDDSLLQRVLMKMALACQAQASLSSIQTGTRLGLLLLAQHRADICALHWGPLEESAQRHPALLQQFPQCRDWVLVRVFRREQGLIVAPGISIPSYDGGEASADFGWLRGLRWAMRQEGSGSKRFFIETLERHDITEEGLNVVATALSEREAAAQIRMGVADIAPGARSAATEFGLQFVPIGWEAFDLALHRGVYFRVLFQRLLEELRDPESRSIAARLGGYDFTELGTLVWAAPS